MKSIWRTTACGSSRPSIWDEMLVERDEWRPAFENPESSIQDHRYERWRDGARGWDERRSPLLLRPPVNIGFPTEQLGAQRADEVLA